MAERFERLFSLPNGLYKEGFPVVVIAGALLKDKETGSVVVQLKFQSLSEISIKALKVGLVAYDVSGKEIEGVSEYQYLDLDISNGQEFGPQKAIMMPNEITRSFSINNISVVFIDGTTKDIEDFIKELPKRRTLTSVLKNQELVKQYQLETNDIACYVPQILSDLYFCPCGSWNSKAVCAKCGLEISRAATVYDIPMLEKKMYARMDVERVENERKRELSKKLELEKKIQNKKVMQKNTRTIIALLLLMIIVASVFLYSIQHKHDDVAGIYALQSLEKSEEVLYDFVKESIDEYGFNPYSYEITIKGSGKIYGLWFVNDNGTLTPGDASIKSVSEDGVCEIEVKDYPHAEVTLKVNTETGEATYISENGDDYLQLQYQQITEELANNGYMKCSTNEIKKDLLFVQNLFDLNSVEAILKEYDNAITEGAQDDVKIDGTFCGADGTYEIWELGNGIYRIIFTQGIYDTNTEKEDLINTLNQIFGEGSYVEALEAYTWENDEYGFQVDYWTHEGVYFFKK